MQMTVCKIFHSNSVNNVNGEEWGGGWPPPPPPRDRCLIVASVILLEVISRPFFTFSGFGIF